MKLFQACNNKVNGSNLLLFLRGFFKKAVIKKVWRLNFVKAWPKKALLLSLKTGFQFWLPLKGANLFFKEKIKLKHQKVSQATPVATSCLFLFVYFFKRKENMGQRLVLVLRLTRGTSTSTMLTSTTTMSATTIGFGVFAPELIK